VSQYLFTSFQRRASGCLASHRMMTELSVILHRIPPCHEYAKAAPFAGMRESRLKISEILSTNYTALSRIYIGNVQHDVTRYNAGVITLYLLTLANRNHPIYVCTTQGSQGQYSQVMLPSAVTSSFANKCRQCK
jgi:hypothetical protein